jgi:small subunit ribosomal protein S7
MRRRRSEKRKIVADSVYNSKLVQKMINMMIWDGKKTKAEKAIYKALDRVKSKLNKNTKEEVLNILEKAIDNIRPRVEVRPRRVGGATYQVPVEVPTERSFSLAIRWIRDFSRARKGKPIYEKLAEEILDAYRGQGSAIKKREDTHKMAEANRAFAHYRW